MAEKNTRVVLASTSPRRKMLMKHLHFDFEIIHSRYKEDMSTHRDSHMMVKEFALGKAQDVAKRMKTKSWIVIGCDTVVSYKHHILGKPKDEEDAIRILKMLSGRTHEVLSGVAIISSTGKKLVKVQSTKVVFRKLSEQEIERYVKQKEPYDKAGAYAIQGTASAFIRSIDGCYTNIIGYPVPLVLSMLKRFGIER